MDEYISKQAFKEKYLCCGWLPEMSKKEFDDFPAADVAPVVRCPQCVHHEDNGYHFCNKWEHFLPDDSAFFCAFGERKEDNT